MPNRVPVLQLTTSVIAECAEIFSRRLPQSLGARIDGKSVILTFIVDEAPPEDHAAYASRHLDSYAVAAYREILSGEDEIDLLLMDVRVVFSVLFWDGQEICDVEFTYYIKDLLFLAGVA